MTTVIARSSGTGSLNRLGTWSSRRVSGDYRTRNRAALDDVAHRLTTIALTGPTGTTGGTAAHLLADAGVPVRLLVRDPSRAPHLAGADVRQAVYGDEQCVAALEGVDTVFMVSAHEDADRMGQHRSFVDAVGAAGVRQIVYLSFVGASVAPSRYGFRSRSSACPPRP